jgi:uncharacterized protein
MKYLLCVFYSVYFTTYAQLTPQQQQDSVWLKNNYTKKEVMIPMRDGVKLFTSIYEPKDNSTKHPILFNRTPYSVRPYGTDKWKTFYDNYYMKYLREGYILVYQDVRGRNMSEGNFIDIRPFNSNKKDNEIDEASDTYDAIEWLTHNTNNNEQVGVIGTSYPGFYATMASLSGHPALKAVSPQAPVTDWFIGDDFHHNGAFCIMDGFDFYTSFGKPRKEPSTEGNKAPQYNYNSADNYDFFLKMGAIKNAFKPQYMDTNVVFWKDLYAHPNYDAWWEQRNVRKYMINIKPALLTVGGLFDAEDCWGAWNLYKAIEKQNNASHYNAIVMGPWVHGGWSRTNGDKLGNVQFGSNTAEYYQNNIEFPFFQKHINNKTEASYNNITEANIFFTGQNQWKHLPAWPPQETQLTKLYLKENNALSFDSPTRLKSETVYISDPAKPVPYTEDVHLERTREYMADDQRFAARRPDVIVFETETLQEDITVAGPIIAKLFTSISSTDADFVVKIIDVFPNDFKYNYNNTIEANTPLQGYQMLVRGEAFRGRYKTGYNKPTAFTPNKVTQINYEMPDIAHTFQKGHKLMIQIQSSWFPLIDRNPQQFVNIFTCDDKDFVKANIRILHNKQYPSHVVIPILKP